MKNINTILITGANRGIGLALVKEALKNNFYVIATYRDPSVSQELLSMKLSNLQTLQLDVKNENSFIKIGKKINTKIDYLICNAGINNGYGSFNDVCHTKEKILDVFNVNVVGAMLTIKYLVEMINNRGKIIFISSIMGIQQHQGSVATAYRSSKAALNNFMVSVSNELKKDNILATSFHPGWVRTSMGGPSANLSTEISAKFLMKQFLKLNMQDSGKFFNYDGSELNF